jgi:hypothetical protein
MTKEEIIMRGKQLGFPRLSKKSHDNQATMITTIVEEAVRLEREACAKVCEELHPGLATNVAAQYIRARGEA